jgi:hypothetical protein
MLNKLKLTGAIVFINNFVGVLIESPSIMVEEKSILNNYSIGVEKMNLDYNTLQRMVALSSIVDIKINIIFFNQGVMNQNMYGLYKAL